MKGDFGFASGQNPDGCYSRIWFGELLPSEEISFDSDVYLLLPKTAKSLKDSTGKVKVVESPALGTADSAEVMGTESAGPLFGQPAQSPAAKGKSRTLRISGEIPTEVWNRLGRTLLPKLKSAGELHLVINASIETKSDINGLRQEIEQILRDLNLSDKIKVDMK